MNHKDTKEHKALVSLYALGVLVIPILPHSEQKVQVSDPEAILKQVQDGAGTTEDDSSTAAGNKTCSRKSIKSFQIQVQTKKSRNVRDCKVYSIKGTPLRLRRMERGRG